MNVEALLFDFNGTLLQDDQENHDAWHLMFRKLNGYDMSDEVYNGLNGKTDPECALYISPSATADEIFRIWNEKEEIYERLCKERKVGLTKFAEEFLSMQTLPMAIATSAPKRNMDWYYPYYSLDRFFPWSHIIVGRDDLRGKPEPDYYLEAARVLEVDIRRCIVFEDSANGIEAARRAGAGKIISLRPSEYADKVIKDFSEVTADDIRI